MLQLPPEGTLDRLIDAPVDLPSCIGFGGPDATTLFVTSIEDFGTGRAVYEHSDGGDWIADLIGWMGQKSRTSVEPSARAETRWMDEVRRLAAASLVRKANTWWTGGNVEGKPQGLTMFVGGFAAYRAACDAVAKDDYAELEFGVPTSTRNA